MQNFERLLAFVKVAELQSFRKAAILLKMSAAAVSKKIAALEKELGLELFLRTTRSVALTEAAQELYERSKQVVDEMAEIDQLASGMKKEPEGRLKIVCGRYFALYWIIPHIEEFYARYPKVKLDIEIGERIPDLEKEGVDLLIGVSMQGPLDAIQKKIATTRYIMAAAPAYLKKRGTPKRLQDLKKHRYINHSMRRPHNVIAFSKKKQLIIEPFLSMNDVTAMIGCAEQGLGIIRTHDYTVEDLLKRGALVEVLREYNLESVPLYAYFRKSSYLPQKIRCFLDFIVEKQAEKH